MFLRPEVFVRLLGAALLVSLGMPAAPPAFQSGKLHGRDAYILENGKMRVTALRGGGHLGEIRLLSEDPRKSINPMYVPVYQTMEPYLYDADRHRPLFGSPLSAGYMGHLLCFPAFGPPTPEEAKQGVSGHGEAAIVEWKQTKPPKVDDKGVTLYYAADLPKSQYRVERTVTLPAGETVVHVEEWIENLLPFDRPYNRDQHATFGAPFAVPGRNMLDLSGVKGIIDPKRTAGNSLLAGREIAWPQGAKSDGSPVSLREFQNEPKTSTLYTVLLDQARQEAYFTLYNADYPILVGYLFPTSDNPWIIDWQENQRGQGRPSNGKMIARGIEFGTSPFDEGLRKSVERASLFGVPSYRWIGARQRLKTTFTVFLAEIPSGFAGVSNVERQGGKIVVTERGSNRQITLASSVE